MTTSDYRLPSDSFVFRNNRAKTRKVLICVTRSEYMREKERIEAKRDRNTHRQRQGRQTQRDK